MLEKKSLQTNKSTSQDIVGFLTMCRKIFRFVKQTIKSVHYIKEKKTICKQAHREAFNLFVTKVGIAPNKTALIFQTNAKIQFWTPSFL